MGDRREVPAEGRTYTLAELEEMGLADQARGQLADHAGAIRRAAERANEPGDVPEAEPEGEGQPVTGHVRPGLGTLGDRLGGPH